MNADNYDMKITTGKVILIYRPYSNRPNSFRTARHAATYWANEKASLWYDLREGSCHTSTDYDKLEDRADAIRKKLIRRSLPIFKKMLAV